MCHRVGRSGIGSLAAIVVAFGLFAVPQDASAEVGFDTMHWSGFPGVEDWADNYGPFMSFAALEQAAIAWCKQHPYYVDPATDCQPLPEKSAHGVEESAYQHYHGDYYPAAVALTNNNGQWRYLSAIWWLHTTDSDCNANEAGEVIDRTTGGPNGNPPPYGCTDPEKLYTAEVPEQPSNCNKTNPCNPVNGNKSQREVDYSDSAGGLSFARYYNSNGANNTSKGMAAGWRHTYSRSVNERPDLKWSIPPTSPPGRSSYYNSAEEACSSGWGEIKAIAWSGDLANATASFSGGSVCKVSDGGSTAAYLRIRSAGAITGFTQAATIKTVTRSNGMSIVFEFDGSNWVNELNPALTFESSGSNWVFTDSNDTRETYDASGKLITITLRNGQSTTLDYGLTVAQGGDDNSETLDSVSGHFGHTMTFGYDASGRLSSVTTPDGTIQYGFDAVDNLISVTYPDTSTRQYVYEDSTLPYHLTGIIDENNDRFATWAYDTAGRAILSEHAGGKEQVQLAYNADGTTTLTMANGAVQNYTFTTAQGQRRVSSMSGDVCSTCPGGDIQNRSYDSNGFIAALTDWNGNVTQTARNIRGLVETRTEAFGNTEQRVTTTQWHANYRLPLTVTSPQNVTDYTYDANGNVLTITVSGGGQSRAWAFTYNSSGQALTIDGPRTDVTDVTTLEYYECTTGNECGQLKSVTNALGHVSNYNSYDSAGRVTQMTEPNGLVTSLTYDSRGRVVTITQTPTTGSPRVTTMAYDNVGQLASYGLPNGTVLTYAYDAAHYLTSITDNLGNYIAYGYDAMGEQTSEDTYDPNDNLTRSVAYTHDLNYRLDTIASGGFTTDVTFDAVGNLTNETDPGNAVTQHAYDALNRLDATTDAMNGVLDYDYDDHDNLTQVVAANGATTDYLYNALDDLESETSPDRGQITYVYDDAGNRVSATDARAVTATYTYDALNRLMTVSYPDATENVTFAYDDVSSNGIGRLRTITDPSGTTTYSYDEYGNVTSDQRQISGVVYTTTYQYDDANNVVSITYPSGRSVSYGRNAIGQVTQITSTKSGISKTILNNATYQPFGPLASLAYGNGLVFDYLRRSDYRITDIDSIGVSDKAYGYDPAGNIVSLSDAIDTEKGRNYTYDALHQLKSEELAYTSASSAYVDAVLADGPLLYWRLGEASGTVAADLSGNAGDGTYSGSVVLGAPGLAPGGDTALRIDTEGAGYVVGPVLTGTTVTGFEAWFQTDAIGNYRDIVSLHNNDSGRYGVMHAPDGRVIVWKGTSFILYSDAVVSSNQPHHVAVWYEAGSNTTYLMVDGVTQQQTFTGNLLAETDPEVLVGVSKYQGALYLRYLGEVDEVAIYDGPVSVATFSDRINIIEGSDFAYDANGNRTSTDDGASVTTYGYQPFSNRLDVIGGLTTQLDAAGNRLADAGGTRTYTYNGAGRLNAVLDNGVQTASYVHNALGQRTQKTVGGISTVYLYDLNGQLIAEHDGTGTWSRDYVWLNEQPVAQVDVGEVFSYLHVDHLGTPRLATDDAQTVVWRWDSDAFGATLADGDPDGDGTVVTVNLRFPGQYYDAESGLHYNYFRTYDPATGRYLESDPVGLAGGLNTYGYVYQNPLSYTDPTGEFVPQLVGALIGAGLEYFTNPCATLGDIALAGAIGAVGGGLGKTIFLRYGARSLTRVTGKEWSHSAGRQWVNRYTRGNLNRALNRRGGLNGSWVDPKRHYRHDPSRYPRGWRDFSDRLNPALQAADRVPDWAKASAASGAAGSAAAGSDCECRQ